MRYHEIKIAETILDEIPDDGNRGGQEPNRPVDNNSTDLVAGPPYPPEDVESVKAMQSRLVELGYSVGSTGVDGKYGPRTTRAVKAFKQDNNLSSAANVMSVDEIEKLASAEKVENPSPTGNEGGGNRAGGTVVDLPNPEGGEGDGQLRINSAALLNLDGGQSRLTSDGAGEEMQATLQMARRMAGIFGQPITINDAIAKRGTSRERDTQGSQHFQGTALDLSTAGFSDEEKLQMVNAAMQAGFSGFGFGQNILHVDRGPRRYWSYGNSTFGGVSVASLGSTVTSGTAVA